MPVLEFSLANNLLLDLGNPTPVPLVAGEPRTLWTSDSITNGALNNSVSVFIMFEAIDPDTAVVSPFSFEMVAILEVQNVDNTWTEIARQNTPIRKLRQGAMREIAVSPAATGGDEGVDTVIAGFLGIPVKLKSRYTDSVEGVIRLRMDVVDFWPEGTHPFVSLTFSAYGRRYDT